MKLIIKVNIFGNSDGDGSLAKTNKTSSLINDQGQDVPDTGLHCEKWSKHRNAKFDRKFESTFWFLRNMLIDFYLEPRLVPIVHENSLRSECLFIVCDEIDAFWWQVEFYGFWRDSGWIFGGSLKK